MNLIKWWKSKFFLKVLLVVFLTMIITFLVAYFTNGYWQLLSIPTACLGGFILRKIVIKKLDEIADKTNKN